MNRTQPHFLGITYKLASQLLMMKPIRLYEMLDMSYKLTWFIALKDFFISGVA
jgi:hypothetical protein